MLAPVMPALRHPGRVDFIDVSQVQASIDFRLVKAAGFEMVVIKASEGQHYCDPIALENASRARDAGLLTAFYGFARPSQGNPRAQARKLWDCVGPIAPGRLVLDLETRPDGWSNEEVIAFAEAYADEQRILDGGSLPWVYSYPHFLMSLGVPLMRSELLGRCPLWMASYKSTTTPWAPTATLQPPTFLPWTDWLAWQYSGNGGYRVPGVPGDCDRNLFNGDIAALRRAFGLPDGTPIPDDEPTLRVPLGRVFFGDEDDDPPEAA